MVDRRAFADAVKGLLKPHPGNLLDRLAAMPSEK